MYTVQYCRVTQTVLWGPECIAVHTVLGGSCTLYCRDMHMALRIYAYCIADIHMHMYCIAGTCTLYCGGYALCIVGISTKYCGIMHAVLRRYAHYIARIFKLYRGDIHTTLYIGDFHTVLGEFSHCIAGFCILYYQIMHLLLRRYTVLYTLNITL